MDLAVDLLCRAPSLRHASVRQYRAVILQRLRDLWHWGMIDPDEVDLVTETLNRARGLSSAEARRLVPDQGEDGDKDDPAGSGDQAKPGNATMAKGSGEPTPLDQTKYEDLKKKDKKQKKMRPVLPPRTSAGRRKSAARHEFEILASDLERCRSSVASITAEMLRLGVLVGTRPGELLTLARKGDGSFWVTSGKYSQHNRRGLEAERQLDLSLMGLSERARLVNLMMAIQAILATGVSAGLLLRRCQALLRRVRNKHGPRLRRICLYTIRQQCAANWKARGVPPHELAVLMGHASADTAQRHYARRSAGWRDCVTGILPAVDPVLASVVRCPDRAAKAPFRQIPSSGAAYRP